MDWWLPFVVVIGGNSLFFVFCSIVKDNSWIDAWWGISFILPLAALNIKRAVEHSKDNLMPGVDARMILSLVLVCIWGLRLCWHIAKRHTKEDFRYVDFRERWNTGGPCWLYTQFYLKIFFLQGVFGLIVNGAAIYIAIYSNSPNLIWTDYLGAAIWLFGFIFELVGDA
jgi:steroid 5-alpha reductase family enzyme